MMMMTMMTTTTHIVFLSLGNLDEHGHQLVELVKGDDLGGVVVGALSTDFHPATLFPSWSKRLKMPAKLSSILPEQNR